MIVDQIQALCRGSGTNFAKLERDCSLANGTIRRWDKSSPSTENLKKVAIHFGVSVDSLLGREDYCFSMQARTCASQFDALPPDKQQLVSAYISIVQAQ